MARSVFSDSDSLALVRGIAACGGGDASERGSFRARWLPGVGRCITSEGRIWWDHKLRASLTMQAALAGVVGKPRDRYIGVVRCDEMYW